MEKTITIDGQDITLKTTGATPLRYKAQFGKDFFSELTKMELKGEKLDASSIDLEVFYNFAYITAKTFDKTITTPMEWFDTFESFPIIDMLPDLQDLLMSTISRTKK